MPFEIMPDTPRKPVDDGSGIVIVSGPGGSPWVTDPQNPHLGGNFDGGDAGSMYPSDLWPWFLKTFAPKTLCDVGCGTGEAMSWFAANGVKVIGIEGLWWNARKAPFPTVQHDLEQGACLIPGIDLVWCSDVAEHVEEMYSDFFLRTATQGRILAMCQGTDAHPNGWHHVNNRTEGYWVEKISRWGMYEDVDATKASREVGNHGWWAVSGRIYRRRS